MATTDDGRPPCESARVREKFRKKPFRPVVKFMKYQVLQCFGHVEQSFSNGVSELKQMLKQTTFTRYERQSFPKASMEKLPDELLLNIFIRLLAKQLAQMRCVSKSWNALLSQSSFIKSHLNRSIQINDQILLAFHTGFPFGSKPFTVLPSHNKLIKSIKLPFINPHCEQMRGQLIGYVNGLICFSYSSEGNSVIHIWNPSLSAILTLPLSSLPFPIVACGYDSIKIHFHFGFDPKTDDYKVVKLTGLSHAIGFPTPVVDEWLQVEVYSLRKGSWEFITERLPSGIIFVTGQNYARLHGLDGHVHWRGYNSEARKETIVAFDLGSLTFREISLPSSILNSIHINVVGVLAGKLCVISWGIGNACEVWVMDEYGVTESWVKRHVFSQFIGDAFAFGFTLRDEFLYKDKDCPLVLYHPTAKKANIFDDMCFGKDGIHNSIAYVLEYVDSLVWITPPPPEV